MELQVSCPVCLYVSRSQTVQNIKCLDCGRSYE